VKLKEPESGSFLAGSFFPPCAPSGLSFADRQRAGRDVVEVGGNGRWSSSGGSGARTIVFAHCAAACLAFVKSSRSADSKLAAQ